MDKREPRIFVYRIDADNRIIYLDADWVSFACRLHPAPPLGAPVVSAGAPRAAGRC